MGELLLGIDVGVTNVKAAVFSLERGRLSVAGIENPTLYPRPGWVEIDPEGWWERLGATVRSALADARAGGADIAAIGISGLGGTPLLLDEQRRPLGNAISYADTRTTPQVRAHLDQAEEILQHSGNPVAEWAVVPKLWWWRDEQPDVYAAASVVLEPVGFVIERLTGELTMDPHYANMVYAYDFDGERWDEPFAERIGVRPDLLPQLQPAMGIAGEVTSAAAELLGLAPGTPVVGCGPDPIPTSLSVGAHRPGDVFLQSGSTANFGILNAQKLRHNGFLARMHVEPGISFVTALQAATGASLKWFRDKLGQAEVAAAQALGGALDEFELMSALAATSRTGSGGVVFFPDIFGRLSPSWDPAMRGTFLGLSNDITRGDLVRAIMEGTAYDLAASLAVAEESVTVGDTVYAGGGPMNSPVWCQIFADVLGKRIAVPTAPDTALFGDALMAAVGAGVTDASVGELIAANVRPGRVHEPDPAAHARHREVGAVLGELYPALVAAHERLAAIRDARGGDAGA